MTTYYDRHTASAPGLAYYSTPSSLHETTPSPPRGSLGEPGPGSRNQPPISLDTNWEPSVPRTPENCSSSTLENARYSLDSDPRPDHPNEDRYFALENRSFKVFAVFDGHDGGRAAGFASSYMRELFHAVSWERALASGGEVVPQALEQFFKATEREFFKGIQPIISEVQSLKSVIPSVS